MKPGIAAAETAESAHDDPPFNFKACFWVNDEGVRRGGVDSAVSAFSAAIICALCVPGGIQNSRVARFFLK
jgi:hypothetical protein